MIALVLISCALLQDISADEDKSISQLNTDLRSRNLQASLAARKQLLEIKQQDGPYGKKASLILDQFNKESIDWALRAGAKSLDVTGGTRTFSLKFEEAIDPKTFSYLYRTPHKTGIDIVGTPIRDEHITSLSSFSELKLLSLISTSVTGECFHDGEWPSLVILNLEGSPITDDAISKAKLPKLLRLDLQRTNITDEALRRISMTQIRELYLNGTKVTTAGLTHLERFPDLRVLSVDAKLLDPMTLQGLLKRVPVQRLKLVTHDIRDASVQELAKFRSKDVEIVIEEIKRRR